MSRAASSIPSFVRRLGLAVGFALAAPPAALATLYTVTTTADSGMGSFRQALIDANAHVGADQIHFAIPGGGVHTITPVTPLPAIQPDAIAIDGLTQTGASCATWPPTLRIELDGSTVGGSGLRLLSDGSTVRGLVIRGFQDGIDITGEANHVECNFIGTDASGTADQGNSTHGVYLNGAVNNCVGGELPDQRNLISGNDITGVVLVLGSTDNEVVNNYIGTDASGQSAIPNQLGVSISGSPDNTVGGPAGTGNLISGNTTGGVFVSGAASTGTLILSNAIGTDADGNPDLGNGGPGVFLYQDASGTLIGSDGLENAIAGNQGYGVQISGNGAIENEIGPNAFYENLFDGIHTGAGANDPGDADEGANRLQNHPELDDARLDTGPDTLHVEFAVPTDPANATYPLTVRFYRADADGEEGESHLRTLVYTESDYTNGPLRSADFSTPVSLDEGDTIVATATDAAGNSSEFSDPVLVPEPGRAGAALACGSALAALA